MDWSLRVLPVLPLVTSMKHHGEPFFKANHSVSGGFISQAAHSFSVWHENRLATI